MKCIFLLFLVSWSSALHASTKRSIIKVVEICHKMQLVLVGMRLLILI